MVSKRTAIMRRRVFMGELFCVSFSDRVTSPIELIDLGRPIHINPRHMTQNGGNELGYCDNNSKKKKEKTY